MTLPRLVVVGDRRIASGEALLEKLRGISGELPFCYQLRERDLDAAELAAVAESLLAVLPERGSLAVNVGDSRGELDPRRLAIARDLGCGAHAPESAARPEGARPRPWSRAVHGRGPLARAAEEGADFVVAGHVYPTPSKPGVAGRGEEWLTRIASGAAMPVFAIGGIDAARARRAVAAGAYGVAVRSGILAAADPRRAAAAYRRALQEGLLDRERPVAERAGR